MINEAEFVKALGLTRVLSVDSKTLPIEVSNTTRPGIQFAWYWDFFAYERPQLLGKVEMTYLSSLHEDVRRERLAKYFSYPLPCVIICRGYPCYDDMRIMAAAHHVPIYSTTKETVQFELDIIAPFYAPAPYAVLLDGQAVMEGKENVFSLYGLTPDTEYSVTLRTDGAEETLKFRTTPEPCAVRLRL